MYDYVHPAAGTENTTLESLSEEVHSALTKYGEKKREKDKAAAIIHPNVPWLSGDGAPRAEFTSHKNAIANLHD